MMSSRNKELVKRYSKTVNLAIEFTKRMKVVIEEIENSEWYYGGKNNASAKRCSLDLTRALAEMRKSY